MYSCQELAGFGVSARGLHLGVGSRASGYPHAIGMAHEGPTVVGVGFIDHDGKRATDRFDHAFELHLTGLGQAACAFTAASSEGR